MNLCVTPGCDRLKVPGRGRKYCAECKAASAIRVPPSGPCSIPGCTRRRVARGWCQTHYEHNRVWGRPEPRSERDRFDQKVDRNGPEFGNRGRCWQWTGTGTKTGYGQLSINGQHRYAHRWAYEHFIGPIPSGLQIDHLCRNRGCVNPAHLEPVTAEENTRRAAAFITHCPAGHLYDKTNTRVRNGTRDCRACDRDAQRRKRIAS